MDKLSTMDDIFGHDEYDNLISILEYIERDIQQSKIIYFLEFSDTGDFVRILYKTDVKTFNDIILLLESKDINKYNKSFNMCALILSLPRLFDADQLNIWICTETNIIYPITLSDRDENNKPINTTENKIETYITQTYITSKNLSQGGQNIVFQLYTKYVL